MKSSPRRPLLIVLSSPSGGGKSTLCRMLLQKYPDMVYSVSCTTRSPRGKEVDGVHYYFLSREDFARRVEAGEFLETAIVHGRRYGTLRATVDAALRSGRSIVMAIDVQGARQIRETVAKEPDGSLMKSAFVDIFIEPPSMETLRSRLALRAEDSPQTIENRLANAAEELSASGEYRHRIVNDVLSRTFSQLEECLEQEWNGRSLPSDGLA